MFVNNICGEGKKMSIFALRFGKALLPTFPVDPVAAFSHEK
jgi:hypothetical protein